jgi:Tfp pilus assembly protein PilV
VLLQRKARAGLSLLEVLLASVIFLMVLAGISMLIRTAVDNALSAYRTNLGSSLARSKMAEIEAAASDVDLTTGGSGSFSDQPDWTYEVTSTNIGYGVYQVDIVVSNSADVNKRDAVRISQMVFDANLLNNAATAQPPSTESP